MLFIVSPLSFSQRSNSPSPEDKIHAYVTDKTRTLSSIHIQSLTKKLSDFEKQTSNQVVVWMISSLEGESLEEKSHEIAEQNGIGQKDKENGVLLFIAKNDRKLRIEVGYGLEGALPDALCDQIIRKEITPQFKKGNFYEGINAGVDAIIKATKGEYTQSQKSDDESGGTVCGIPLFLLFIILIFILVFGIPILSSIFGRGGGRWATGGTRWSSGSSSSWSSGSSFSSGGFSGGGGSFGGGGASGSW
ncbi:MAG: TPM domain-containing protein [Chlorobi bacterium]|nr:TPM domain-containing protein [Chlorobiota bacterium]